MRKSTGIVRRVDELGRVVLPVELRRLFQIENHDPLEISVDGVDIILRKYSQACVFCGAQDEPEGRRVDTFRGKAVCRACRGSMAAQAV